MFSQWISGQPWWLTVLMLPVWIVLACLGFVLKQLGLAALFLAAVGGLGLGLRRLRRRPEAVTREPGSTPS